MKAPEDDRSRYTAATLRAALAAAGHDLPQADHESIGTLVEAGEWSLALDTLCTQLYEYDVELPARSRRDLVLLGTELGVPVSYLLGDPWSSPDGTIECD